MTTNGLDAGQPDVPLPAPERPVDRTTRHTSDLPDTPTRDRTIPATAWAEAPAELVALGKRFGGPRGLVEGSVSGHDPSFLRRVGPWLLWRAGPAHGGEACLWACRADDLTRSYTFRLHADGSGEGTGPSGEVRNSFRTWKEDLRDNP
ncbi:MAG: hypothetical protein KDB02_09085 [Acidimicrobiales bacterium]|nr:hypothetical protein [Acidimicrobiales bacterium]